MKIVASLAFAISTVASVALAGNQAGGAANADFDGFYIGGGFGWGTGDGYAEYPLVAGGTNSGSIDLGTGHAYSFYGGYNHQRGSWVYGVEGNYTNFNGLLAREASGPEVREVLWVGDLRGRVGYVTGDFLFYGTLGWSWSSMRVHPGLDFGSRPNTADLDGFNYGIGAEYAINDKWSAGADLTFRNLDGQFGEATTATDVDVNTLNLRLGFRF